ncbi:hypothetical protein Cantr_03436 [Candida viswanathii]|uniref:C2H2-type domain-containing protein n=1 Tax=Candida viswanathii TaxID=5486 RepID=A0A367YP10_9ASCO|nr:hypothetical protein Cantr_03436 [Candida viswanathii]
MSNETTLTPSVPHTSGVNIDFHPNELVKRITKEIPRSLPYYNNSDVPTEGEDPIVTELMKLHPHNSRLVISNIAYNEQVVQYSAKLQELLYLLLDEQQLDDNIRINIETSLSELTTSLPILKHDNYVYEQAGASNRKFKNRQYLPRPQPTDLTYPNNYLSKILIDNFDSLIRFSKTYFNLSLASQITKYTVELIYQLYYWEVVHLVYLNPNLVDFLTLLKFEIINTSFGPIIRPPDTYLNDNMLQGLQYPYPYPFYNYSYHSFNGRVENDKFNKVKITPYMDITLKNYNGTLPTKRKRGRKPKAGSYPQDASFTDADGMTPIELSRTVSETSDNENPEKKPKAEIHAAILPSRFFPAQQQQQSPPQPPVLPGGPMSSSTPQLSHIQTDASPSGPQPLTTFLPHARTYPRPNKRGAIYGNSQSPQYPPLPHVGGHVAGESSSPPLSLPISTQGAPPQPIPGALRHPVHQQFTTASFHRPQLPGAEKQPSLGVNADEIRIPPIASASASPSQMERQLLTHQQLQSPAAESMKSSGSVHSALPSLNPIANYKHLPDNNLLPSISKLRSDQLSPITGTSIPGSQENRTSPTASPFGITKGYPFSKTELYLQPTPVATQSPGSAGSMAAAAMPSHQLQSPQQMYASSFSTTQPAGTSVATRPAAGSSSQGFYPEQNAEDKTKKQKSGVIHQCHLTDPNTMAECMKIFYGKNELLRHQEFVHATKKKIYKCIYCAKNGAKVQSYPRHDSLARHIRRKHGITGKENKMAVNYAKENVEIIDPDQLVTKQHDFQDPSAQGAGGAQVVPQLQILYSHPIRYGRPAPIPSYLQHRRLNLFPQTHRLNKGQQRAYAMVGGQTSGSQAAGAQTASTQQQPTTPQNEAQPQAQPQGSPQSSSSFQPQGSPPQRPGTMLPSPSAIVNSPPYNAGAINVASPQVHDSANHTPNLQEGSSNTESQKQ